MDYTFYREIPTGLSTPLLREHLLDGYSICITCFIGIGLQIPFEALLPVKVRYAGIPYCNDAVTIFYENVAHEKQQTV